MRGAQTLAQSESQLPELAASAYGEEQRPGYIVIVDNREPPDLRGCR
jgi:hypothetical protein